MKRLFKWIGILLIITACTQEGTSNEVEERITPVKVESIQKTDFIIERKIAGRATPADSSPVISQTPGELVTLNVSKGDQVEKGETIGVVDPGSGADQVELQQLAVRQAEKQLENAQISERQAEVGIENAKDQVELARQASKAEESQSSQATEAAREQYEQAQQIADETKQLLDEGAIPQALYDQAQNRADQAQAQYQQLKQQQPQSSSAIAQAEAQVDQAEQQYEQARVAVEQAELQVEQANVQLKQAQDQASNEVVTSLVSGEISTLDAKEGDFVTNQQPFATIVSLHPMTVTALITAEQLPLFDKGEELEVHFPSIDKTMTPVVDYVSSVPDDTGLYPVEASINNNEEKIKPGMMATFLIRENVVEDTLVVPTDSLVEENEETFVYQVIDEEAVRVSVKVVESQTDVTAVSADLSEDAEVITTGKLTLTDGGKVNIMKEEGSDEAR